MQSISNKKTYKKISNKYFLIMVLNIITMNSSIGMFRQQEQEYQNANEPTSQMHARSRSASQMMSASTIPMQQMQYHQDDAAIPIQRSSSYAHHNQQNNNIPDGLDSGNRNRSPNNHSMRFNSPQGLHQNHQIQMQMQEEYQQQSIENSSAYSAQKNHHSRNSSSILPQQLAAAQQQSIHTLLPQQIITHANTNHAIESKKEEKTIPIQAIKNMANNPQLNTLQRRLMSLITQGASVLTRISFDSSAGTNQKVTLDYQKEKFLVLLNITQNAPSIGPAQWASDMQTFFLTYNDFVGKLGISTETSQLDNFPSNINDQFKALAKHTARTLTYFGNAARDNFSSDHVSKTGISVIESLFDYIETAQYIQLEEVMKKLGTLFGDLENTPAKNWPSYAGINKELTIFFDSDQYYFDKEKRKKWNEDQFFKALRIIFQRTTFSERPDVNALHILADMATIAYNEKKTTPQVTQDELTCWEETTQPCKLFCNQSWAKITQQIGIFTGLNIIRSLLLIGVAIAIGALVYVGTRDFGTGNIIKFHNNTSGEAGALITWKK